MDGFANLYADVEGQIQERHAGIQEVLEGTAHLLPFLSSKLPSEEKFKEMQVGCVPEAQWLQLA